ncbi:hypothetical protein AAFN90_07445 [Erwiniaceae bacterium CAU 1747]
MKQKNRVMGLMLVAGATGVFTQWAQASTDVGSCPWSAKGCLIASPPVLDIGNDTRDNLLRLLGEKKAFVLPVLPDTIDAVHSRNYYFAPHLSEWYDQIQDQGAPEPSVAELPVSGQARQLGVDVGLLEQFREQNNGLEDRHVSNSLGSVEQFYRALLAEPSLTPEQRQSLALARLKVNGSAEGQAEITALAFPANSAAGEFRLYLLAANQFYSADYPAATAAFSALSKTQQPWLAETAGYMLMRTSLNRSSANANGMYGDFDVKNIDKSAATEALTQAQSYLQKWPKGQYAESARGMQRRINWYLEDWDDLAQESEQALQQAGSIEALISLVAEIDNKLLSKDMTRNDAYFLNAPAAPLLTFTQTLRLMRSSKCDGKAPCVDQAYLEQIKPIFDQARQLPLWHYLTLLLAEQKQDYATVLSAIKPAESLPERDILAFSNQALYGEVLMDQKNWDAARQHWLHLLTLAKEKAQQQMLQAMLAATLVKSGHPEQIFAADSQVTNLRYRSLVLKTLATPDLLRQQVKEGASKEEKSIALHTLLMKDLIAGRYGDWLQHKKLTRDLIQPRVDSSFSDVDLTVFDWSGEKAEPGYHCAPLEQTVSTLNARADDARALNCLGEFFRITRAKVDSLPDEDGTLALGSSVGEGSGGTPNRQAYYLQVIQNPRAEPEDKSFALYRAVMCYAPSGFNDCGGQEAEPATRKAWFNRLKSDYRGGPWAQRLKYYW